MQENKQAKTEMPELDKSSWREVTSKLSGLAKNYADILPSDSIFSAFSRAGRWMMNQPQVQNQRVKSVSTLPINYTKDEIGEFLRDPYRNEKPLRQTSEILRYTAYPFYKIIKTYQDMPSYKHYFRPLHLEGEEAKTKDFMREAILVDKFNKVLSPKLTAHKIVGQAMTEGKVFYFPRYRLDKAHNQVDYAMLQQLPQDWCQIIGYNNISGYTVSFDMMYFMQEGTSVYAFGDLFEPYLEDFNRMFDEPERNKIGSKKVVYASCPTVQCGKQKINFHPERVNRNGEGNPDVFEQDGRWMYNVSLPIDRVWTFSVDDTSPAVVSPLSGLMLTYSQQVNYEDAQLSIVLNPLVMFLTGEMDFFDNNTTKEDDYRLSLGGRELFEMFFYNMLSQNNTSGVGWYTAPVKNIKSHTFPESANSNEISQSFSEYASGKSGLSALVPVNSNDVKAGQVASSQTLESKYVQTVLNQYERMMTYIYGTFNLKHQFEFHFIGNIFNEKELIEHFEKAISRGDMSAYFPLAALDGQSWVDKISDIRVMKELGVNDLLEVPPNANTQSDKSAGRPKTEGTSEAKEKAIDAGNLEE